MLPTALSLLGRRLIAAIPVLLLVSALLFCVLRVLPVDPAAMSLPPSATIAEIEAQRREMGLDRPLALQYLIWLKGALHGEFGRSIHYRRDAGALVAETLPATLELAIIAMAIAGTLGLCGGLFLFRLRRTPFETLGDLSSMLLLSIPEFLWGLILLFCLGLSCLSCRSPAGFHPASFDRTSPASCCWIHFWSGDRICSGTPSRIWHCPPSHSVSPSRP